MNPFGEFLLRFLRHEETVWAEVKAGKVKNSHASGRVVPVLEGGYNLAGLAAATAAHVQALAAA